MPPSGAIPGGSRARMSPQLDGSPHSRGAFSRHGEAVRKPRDKGRPAAAPLALGSASDRLFLSGLLASRARLRFTGCGHSEVRRRSLSIADKTKEKAQEKSA